MKENVRVFLEDGGTEIDDNDCFLALKESTVLVVGSEWHARSINSTVTAPLGSKQSDSTDQSDPAMDIDTSGIDDISSLGKVTVHGLNGNESTSKFFAYFIYKYKHDNISFKRYINLKCSVNAFELLKMTLV